MHWKQPTYNTISTPTTYRVGENTTVPRHNNQKPKRHQWQWCTVSFFRPRRAPGSGDVAKTRSWGACRTSPFRISEGQIYVILYHSLLFVSSFLLVPFCSSSQHGLFVFVHDRERGRERNRYRQKRGTRYEEFWGREAEIDVEWSESVAHHRCPVFLVRREYLAGRTESSSSSSWTVDVGRRLRDRRCGRASL